MLELDCPCHELPRTAVNPDQAQKYQNHKKSKTKVVIFQEGIFFVRLETIIF